MANAQQQETKKKNTTSGRMLAIATKRRELLIEKKHRLCADIDAEIETLDAAILALDN
jgi:hypothetical protein